MHDLAVIKQRQKAQVQREYDWAIDEENYAKADRIYAANPDITPFWLQNANPDSEVILLGEEG